MEKFLKAALLVILGVLVLVISGCAQSSLAQPVATAPRLSTEIMKNAEYQSKIVGEKKVRLVNGTYEEASAPNSASQRTVILLENLMAFGDLNSDGTEDAAAVLASNGGGSGTFIDLVALLNQGGNPNHVASVTLGDRVKVESISVNAGIITVNYLKQGLSDPLTNPTLRTIEKFKLQGDKLVKVD